jgi:hypothetical protein
MKGDGADRKTAGPCTHRNASTALRERLACPDAFLSRTDLAELGLPRRAIDCIFRAVDVVAIPGFSRPLIRVADYHAFVERSTYSNERPRVRPT